ncbi:MAG: preprotein translocase subunit YajC, partial [Spirochaetia bacterium]|nr:preprotein translocase subunit YajC [Spirochaetia bacterium]
MTTLFSSLPFLLAAPEGGTSSSGGSMVTTFITFGLIIVVFYFLIIRPQRKRDKDTKAMINAVKKGDKVVTIGGIRGTVMSVKDTVIVLKVDDNTKLEFNKSAVSTVLEKKGESP